jgi:NifB/MoaA-like Fe-S oxidoreductase
MRAHTAAEAAAVVDCVEDWQDVYLRTLGRRLAYAADEYYLLADRRFPPAETYEGFPMHEDGIGMARTFEREFTGHVATPTGPRAGFFAWVDGAPAASVDGDYEPYRADRTCGSTGTAHGTVTLRPRRSAPLGILTGAYGAQVLEPLVASLRRPDVRLLSVPNVFFGGNIGVTGLMVGQDVARVLADQPAGHRYLLPDVCLSQGRFLDGTTPADLPRPVDVVPTDGISLRRALGE